MAKIVRYNVFSKEKHKVILTGKDKEEAEKLERGETRRCPRCDSVIESSAGRCESCGAVFNVGTGSVAGVERVSDEELIAKIKPLQEVAHKGATKVGIGLVMTIVGFIMGALGTQVSVVLTVIGFVLGGVGLLVIILGGPKGGAAFGQINRDVTNAVILPALEQVFANVQYQKRGCINAENIRQSELIPIAWNRLTGSDHVRATYQGMQIELSDVRLWDVKITRDEDGHRTEHSELIFEGMWLVCDFDKPLTADLRLQEKGGSSKLGKKLQRKKSDVKTDNAAFNEQFVVKSQHPHDVFYILTPHMMEFIMRADVRSAGDTFMCFMPEGKVHIAINSGRDAFEFDWRKIADALPETRQRFVSEIRYITDIIDELRLTDTMFRK